MGSNVYNLAVIDFREQTYQAFKALWQENYFFDVTLVSEDGESFKAHKLVLALFSPVLKKMLQTSQLYQHTPLIYLSGIENNEMKALIDFMYLGEVKVEEKNLERFLNIGEKLRIKGLTKSFVEVGTEGLDKSKDNEEYEYGEQSTTENIKPEELYIDIASNAHEDNVLDKTNVEKCSTNEVHKINSKISSSKGDQYQFNCDKCDYRSKQAQKMRLHVDAKHNNVRYTCDLCGFTTSWPNHLYTHKKTKHS